MKKEYAIISPERIRANFAQIEGEVAEACRRAGRTPESVEILIATKYVSAAGMESLADAGIKLVGENKAQDLAAKHRRFGDRFTYDFIGHLQSNKAKQVLPIARRIHSVESLSLLAEIEKHATAATDLLLEVNISEEPSKYGIIPDEVDRFLEEAAKFPKVNFTGLMTMPPLADDPEAVRPAFAALRRLVSRLSPKWQGRFQFQHLSMGTSSDFLVAVAEGSTIVRVGRALFDKG